jgi:hypothetical protein
MIVGYISALEPLKTGGVVTKQVLRCPSVFDNQCNGNQTDTQVLQFKILKLTKATHPQTKNLKITIPNYPSKKITTHPLTISRIHNIIISYSRYFN